MNWRLIRAIEDLWEKSPIVVVLGAFGIAVFLFVVIDTWFLKRRRRKGPPER